MIVIAILLSIPTLFFTVLGLMWLLIKIINIIEGIKKCVKSFIAHMGIR